MVLSESRHPPFFRMSYRHSGRGSKRPTMKSVEGPEGESEAGQDSGKNSECPKHKSSIVGTVIDKVPSSR
jgi:hypothetical protein